MTIAARDAASFDWRLAWVALVALGCANGGEGPIGDHGPTAGEGGSGGQASNVDGGAPSLSSGGGDNAGAGGAVSTTTQTGPGPSTSTTTSTGSGFGGAGTGGGDPVEPLDHFLILAGGGTATVVSTYDVVMNSGFSWPWSVMTTDPIALSRPPLATSQAFLRKYDDGVLYHASHLGNGWTDPEVVQASLSIVGPPASASVDDVTHAAYRLPDGSYGYSRLVGSTFATAFEPVGSPASTGASPPAIAATPTGAVVAYIDETGDLVDRERVNGSWGAPHVHAVPDALSAFAPALLAPTSGPELIVAFVRASDGMVQYQTRTNGVWSVVATVPATVPSTGSPVLASLADGEIDLAYLGPDHNGYMSTFSAAAFDAPIWLVQGVICPPAITRGAEGAEMDLVFVDQTNVGYWARRIAGQWTTPTFVASAAAPSCVATTAAP